MELSVRKPVLREDWAVGFYKSANEAWENLFYGLNKEGDVSSPRGLKIKETLGCCIYILDVMDNLVYNTYRGLSPIYIAKEKMWYESGDRSVEEASKLSKFWETIANPDGTVNSNYGAYIFVKEDDGKTVWEKTVDILKKDPDSRQAVIQIPIMPARGTKDTPCTSSLQFIIRDNKLFCTVYMRSTDVILGFPIDIFQFTMWQIEMAKELGCELGWMRFISGSIHCYEKHWLKDNDSFMFEKSLIVRSDKASDSFRNDIEKLSEKQIDFVKDETLNFMIDNKKIWK